MVRLAGFLHPVVPDRTAFGAAAQREAHGNHAENQYQSPQHHHPTPTHALPYGLKSGIFKPPKTDPRHAQTASLCAPDALWHKHHPQSPPRIRFMPDQPRAYEQKAEEFDIEEARRVLGDVFAPWVLDLGLSISS